MFEQCIMNVEDISTVIPTKYDDGPGGVVVTFMSKGTSIELPSMTVEGFASLLNGAVF